MDTKTFWDLGEKENKIHFDQINENIGCLDYDSFKSGLGSHLCSCEGKRITYAA